jgi:hypothetical protein
VKLAHIATTVAADIYTRPIDPDRRTAAVVRDACDLATTGDLSTSMLDRLCDMVELRLRNPSRYRLAEVSLHTQGR